MNNKRKFELFDDDDAVKKAKTNLSDKLDQIKIDKIKKDQKLKKITEKIEAFELQKTKLDRKGKRKSNSDKELLKRIEKDLVDLEEQKVRLKAEILNLESGTNFANKLTENENKLEEYKDIVRSDHKEFKNNLKEYDLKKSLSDYLASQNATLLLMLGYSIHLAFFSNQFG